MNGKDRADLEQVVEALKKNRFQAFLASGAEEGKRMVLERIPPQNQVGIGDAATLRQMGLADELKRRGWEIVNPFVRELTATLGTTEPFVAALRRSLTCDTFITSTNALTRDGKLFNVDGVGNRVAAIAFGPPQVILVIGRNKIVADLGQAQERMKTVIAPTHAKWKKKRTPCAVTGKCADCSSPERICNITQILDKKPARGNVTVILVDEDLGLGWDPAWPQERREAIELRYGAVTWEFVNPWHPVKSTQEDREGK